MQKIYCAVLFFSFFVSCSTWSMNTVSMFIGMYNANKERLQRQKVASVVMNNSMHDLSSAHDSNKIERVVGIVESMEPKGKKVQESFLHMIIYMSALPQEVQWMIFGIEKEDDVVKEFCMKRPIIYISRIVEYIHRREKNAFEYDLSINSYEYSRRERWSFLKKTITLQERILISEEQYALLCRMINENNKAAAKQASAPLQMCYTGKLRIEEEEFDRLLMKLPKEKEADRFFYFLPAPIIAPNHWLRGNLGKLLEQKKDPLGYPEDFFGKYKLYIAGFCIASYGLITYYLRK